MNATRLFQKWGRAWLGLALLALAPLSSLRGQTAPDYGDAPSPYPTLANSNGARHSISGGVFLGARVDGEADGQPDANALGDDNLPAGGLDDEDGVTFTSLVVAGQTATIQVVASTSGFLNAWMDFNRDGDWADAGEQIFTARALAAGVNTLTFAVPSTATVGATFARFRFSTTSTLSFTGAASNGEVEDYQVVLRAPADFGDAPASYATLLADNGPVHTILQGFCLGSIVDGEPNGQPSAGADGDDLNPSDKDDEDGVVFLTDLDPGKSASVRITCTIPAGTTGRINAWIDFNGNGVFDHPSEQIFADLAVGGGAKDFSFTVPTAAVRGPTYARFRLSRDGKLSPGGAASDGEVEDYAVSILQDLDFGDAPGKYPTLLASNGARHGVDAKFCLGSIIDTEKDGQPDPLALGDDKNPSTADDEDGIKFTSDLIAGQVATVDVFTTIPSIDGPGSARLDAWVDFNQNESWADDGEQIFVSQLVTNGMNHLSFFVPSSAGSGSTFARFRLSRQGGLAPVGYARDGEVEDYQVDLKQLLDFGDAPRPYPTLLTQNGARHIFSKGFLLGSIVDLEPDGQPNSTATGDDANPAGAAGDEDGVVFVIPLVPGRTAIVRVTTPASRGFLNAWVDFNGNSSWADAGEQIITAMQLSPGSTDIPFDVPIGAVTGVTFARFRFSSVAQLSFTGLAPDGEVEDYAIRIIPDRDRCDLDCEGRDFWLTFPGNYAPDPDNPVQLSLAIQGPAGAVGQVLIPGLGFAKNFVIPATLAAIVNLPKEADLGDLNDQVKDLGIHVIASTDVSVAAFNHVKYTSDSYLALQTSILGTEYIVVGFGNLQKGVPPLSGTQFALVGTETNTLVRITPSVTTMGHPANVPFLLTLQPGEVYQLRNTNDAPADLTGTLVKSDKPVGLFAGHQCANVPSSNVWFCDYVVEHILPVNTWGNDFYTAPLATRTNGDTFRFVAAYDNTQITVNGVLVATLNRGKFHQMKLVNAAHIQSDQPIFVAQYANSSDFDNVPQSDPFMLTVPATRHYVSRYLLTTPTNDFTSNFIHIIAATSSIPTMQINGAAIPAASFQAIAGTVAAYARVPVGPGTYLVTGGNRFSAAIYGWGLYDSYGHPGCYYLGDVRPPNVTTSVSSLSANVTHDSQTPGYVAVPTMASYVSSTDNCSQRQTTPRQTPAAGALLGPGVHTITINVDDENGNIGTADVTYTVIDPTPVVIDCPADIKVDCTQDGGAFVDFVVKAHSDFDDQVPVTCDPPPGSFFPAGTTTVTCVAASLAGQTARCTFTVTVTCGGRAQIALTQDGRQFTVDWTGSPATLEEAPSPEGPWLPVIRNANRYTAPLGQGAKFYRVRY